MIKELKESNYFAFEGKFYSSFFKKEVEIYIKEGATVEYAENA